MACTRRAAEAPSAPGAAPISAPPSVAPSANAVTVTAHVEPRPRSPSGVMLASIDSPQGDQAARTAASTAATRANCQ